MLWEKEINSGMAPEDQSPSDRKPDIYRELFRKLSNNVKDGDNEMWQPFNKDKFTIEQAFIEKISDETRECKVGSARHDKYDQPSFFAIPNSAILRELAATFTKLNQHWLVFTKLKQQGLVTSGVVCL